METTVLASFWVGLGSVLLILVSILLIGLILLQKNRGAGLSGAFGGVGGHTAFGTKTGDFLTWVTVGLTALFLLLSVLLNYAFEPTSLAGTTGTGAVPGATTAPAPATPGQTPAGQVPLGQTPSRQVPVGQTPPRQVPVGQTPPRQVPVGQTPPGPKAPEPAGPAGPPPPPSTGG